VTRRRLPLLLVVLLAVLAPCAAAGAQTPMPPVPFNPGEYPDPYDPGVTDLPAPRPRPAPKPQPALPVVSVPVTTIAGTQAMVLPNGRAAIPRGAPLRVQQVVAAANLIIGKRYKWGGGHALVDDKAYDCSGAVGYGLIKTGMLNTTMVSGSFARWAAAGDGRWMTIYANSTHVYTEIAGLRLDTSPFGDPAGASGVRWRPAIGGRSGFKVRHPIGF
jgi:hypothetical protein